MKHKRITVQQASELLGVSPQFLRIALQQNKFPFGTAVKTSKNRWTYYINYTLFMNYLCGNLDKLATKIDEKQQQAVT